MEKIIILSFVGIGPLKLGMSEFEVQAILEAKSYLEDLFSGFEYDEHDKLRF
ncbi:hypothetical protein J2W91_004649 [Paenibacillus amylolyticus]|uniref:Uncharacterized protein n=1 Tax=Paenibacillus amylolyticus TaxID=1451 RepID=A0AAP5H4E5_PAEAM|nr:hypothetical protein [Paenibacillus amylolyticus]MDR6726143.1 hypothetical protein [Paenibacillus amylolyticus]